MDAFHAALKWPGLVDYRDPERHVFRQCRYWDPAAMLQLFRFELIKAMFRAGVLTAEIAENLLSWRHSGFHVHATAKFSPSDTELLCNKLAYTFRPALSLNRLSFDGERVRYRSRRQTLDLTPVEFLARLTLHIPVHSSQLLRARPRTKNS